MVSKHNFESVAIKKKQQPFSSSDKKLSKLIKIIFFVLLLVLKMLHIYFMNWWLNQHWSRVGKC